MIDRPRSLRSFLELLNELEAKQEQTAAFEIYFSQGEKLTLQIEVINVQGKRGFKLIKGEKDKD